ncbi:MAG: glycerophosphodiester phosphodiesterase family protein [Eubacteriaceae bacterium]|nr:glycerophosphodiester phosphodiesterase family protein [Eubacteriaceae bacterium]
MNIKDDSWLITRPIAHRGLHDDEYPENTLPAFELAAAKDYPIELDVRLSKDGKLFVLHDRNILRVTGTDRDLSDMTADELSGTKVLGSEFPIPSFKNVLAAIDGRVPILIEIKSDSLPGRLEKKLGEILVKYIGEYAIESFNPASLLSMRSRKKELGFYTGQLSYLFEDYDMPGAGKWLFKDCHLNFIVKPDFIAYDITALPRVSIERERSRGIGLLGWTVQNDDDKRLAEDLCDNYIFEGIRP